MKSSPPRDGRPPVTASTDPLSAASPPGAGVTEGPYTGTSPARRSCARPRTARSSPKWPGRKQAIVRSSGPIPHKFRSWILVTYEYHDRFPEISGGYRLCPAQRSRPPTPDPGRRRTAGGGAGRHDRGGGRRGEVDDPDLAVSHFTGHMLNLPRLIGESSIPGSAVQYLDAVVEAVYRVFGIPCGGEEMHAGE